MTGCHREHLEYVPSCTCACAGLLPRDNSSPHVCYCHVFRIRDSISLTNGITAQSVQSLLWPQTRRHDNLVFDLVRTMLYVYTPSYEYYCTCHMISGPAHPSGRDIPRPRPPAGADGVGCEGEGGGGGGGGACRGAGQLPSPLPHSAGSHQSQPSHCHCMCVCVCVCVCVCPGNSRALVVLCACACV